MSVRWGRVFHMNMQSKMKTIGYIFSFVAVVFSAIACSGYVDENALPILTVNATEIDMASDQRAEFTVTYNGVDVTSSSTVSLSADSSKEVLDNAVFVPEAVGTYVFVAEYEDRLSNPVAVKVIDSTPVVIESAYERHVCVVELTGAWCINCPEGYGLMFQQLSIPSYKKYKENMHLCAFHSDREGKDDMAIPQTQDVYKLAGEFCNYSLGYPSFCVDFHTSGILASDTIGDFVPAIKASHEKYPAHCGVSVSSVLNADKTKAEVTAAIASELTSDYRMIILVIENKIKGWQKTTLYPDGQEDYIHTHVVRKVVTEYPGTFTGEKLADDAEIKAGEEGKKTWNVDVDAAWVLENTQIYAIALDVEGRVNNMNVCAIDGGDSGYDLKQN